MWTLSLRFPHQNPVYASPFPICATYPAHLILLDFITRTILGEEYRSLSFSLCSFFHFLITTSLLDPNILLNVLFLNTLSLCFSCNVIDSPWCHWGFFPWFLPIKPCTLRSTQPLKMSTRDFSGGKDCRCIWLTTYHPCSAECRDDPGP